MLSSFLVKIETKLWNREYLSLFAIATLSSVAFQMATPILPKYATQLGATLAVAGVVAGIFSFTALVARPLSGLVADRVEKRRLSLVATAVLAISTFGYFSSTSVAALAAWRVLHGAAFGFASTSEATLVTRYIPRERLGEGLGYYGLGQVLGLALGPAIGIAIGEAWGYKFSFLISAGLVLLAALGFLLLPPEDLPDRSGARRIVFGDLFCLEVLPYAVLASIIAFSNGATSSFILLLGDARHIASAGLYFTVYSIFLLLVRPIAGRLSDRLDPRAVVIPAIALAIGEALLLAFASSLWMVLAAAFIKAVAMGSAMPTLQSASLRSVDSSRSGVATSSYFLGFDVGMGLGPIAGGAISSALGFEGMFLSCGGLLIFGLGLAIVSKRRSPAITNK
jgi:Arabinose efflux permease